MRLRHDGRMAVSREETIALLEKRREELYRLEAYLRENPELKGPAGRHLHTARWSVGIIEERLRKEGTNEQEESCLSQRQEDPSA